jgi:hypothetical protein
MALQWLLVIVLVGAAQYQIHKIDLKEKDDERKLEQHRQEILAAT